MKTPIISLQNVRFTYRIRKGMFQSSSYNALRSVSFDIHRGETIGLIGRNGCGKSTLLRLLARISKPDSGSITFADNITVSLLTLQAGFDQDLPGRDNVILSGMLLGMPYRVVLSRLERIIAFAEIGPFIDEPLRTYSDGMRARLGFALAMELAPDVILVDEVLGVGDAAFLRKAKNSMRHKLTSDQTVVYVSHDLDSVRELCDTVVWIEDGATHMSGKAAAVIEAYLQATIAREKEREVEAVGGQPAEAPAAANRDHISPREVGLVVSHDHGLEKITESLEALAKLPAAKDMGILMVACHGPAQEARDIYDWALANWTGGADFLPEGGSWKDIRENFSGKKCRCLVMSHGPERTEAHVRNAAVRVLLEMPHPNWVWFLSSGVTAVPGSPRALLRHMLARPKAVIGASVEDADQPEKLKCAGGYSVSPWNMDVRMVCAGLHKGEASLRVFERLDAVYEGCLALPLEAFQSLGFFDEELSTKYSVLDFCARASLHGYAMEWCSPARVRTRNGRRPRQKLQEPHLKLEEMLIQDVRSAILYTRRNQPRWVPWFLVRRVLLGIVFWTIRGQWRLVMGFWNVLKESARNEVPS